MNDAHMDTDDADQPTRPLEDTGGALAETVEDLEDDVLILQARVADPGAGRGPLAGSRGDHRCGRRR